MSAYDRKRTLAFPYGLMGLGLDPAVVKIAARDYSFRCAAGPSSSGWPHGHRVDWEDQMVVNAQKPTHAEQGLTAVVCTPSWRRTDRFQVRVLMDNPPDQVINFGEESS
jgi:hypothetical protein